MAKMLECWVNVYAQNRDRHTLGLAVSDKAASQIADAGASYRLHIRLKPPGAPKRYADDNERRLWETGMLGPARASYIAEKTRERLA